MDNRETARELANFAYNVTWLRKHSGKTKKQMAQLLRIGVRSLTKLEQGIIPPKLKVDVLFYIYEEFYIRPDELLARRFRE